MSKFDNELPVMTFGADEVVEVAFRDTRVSPSEEILSGPGTYRMECGHWIVEFESETDDYTRVLYPVGVVLSVSHRTDDAENKG